MLLARKHTPNAATRIWHITRIPRNQMNVDVHSRLTAGFADIYANVVAVG